MLSDLRKALANTIQLGLPTARGYPYPPRTVDVPTSGVAFYIRPASNTYLNRWLTFSPAIWSQVRYEVVIRVCDDNPERAADLLDSVVDPGAGQIDVFGAIYNNPTLGITAYKVDAQPMFEEPVEAAERIAEADGNVTYWEIVFPVQIIVNVFNS